MNISLSSVQLQSLTSVIDNSSTFKYMNNNRCFNEVSALSTYNGIPFIINNSLKYINDIAINNDSFVFLTNTHSLSTFINDTKILTGSTKIGFDGVDYFNKYYFCPENDIVNKDITIKESTYIKSNHLLICPINNLKYNIIPLKTPQEQNYEYNYYNIKNKKYSRNYTSVFYGNNQEGGYRNLYTKYTVDRIPVIFKTDIYTNFYIPQDNVVLSLSDSEFYYNGAIGGNCPCNSDVILHKHFGYGNYTDSGFPKNNYNGIPLCLWLSASTTCSNSAIWMERWYDPNSVTQGTAFIIQKQNVSATLNSIVDIPSNHIIYPKNSYTYLRYGAQRNNTFVNSFSSNLICNFNTWNTIIIDNINNIRGFSVGLFPEQVDTSLSMNGKFHMHIPPTSSLLIQNDYTLGMWVYQDSWTCGRNTEGYGIGFNTSANPELITLPTTSGYLYGFNYKGQKVFEKLLTTSLGISATQITYIMSDLFGSKWLYDNLNKSIYKLETDNLLTYKIDLPNNSNITKMEINSQNKLSVFDINTHTISSFDTKGQFDNNPIFTLNFNNFVLDKNDTIKLAIADYLLIDNNNDKLSVLGINLYKNNKLFFHIGYKINAINIDSSNNYWILYNGNKLLKLTCLGTVIFNKTLNLPFTQETSYALNFVKESKNNCDYDLLWLIFNHNKYVLKLDADGNIIKRLNISDIVNLKKCGDFDLSVSGDFTGFDLKRKYQTFTDGTLVTSSNPAITLNINLICGTRSSILQINTPAKFLAGWNHLSFSYSILNNNTVVTLYINGIAKCSKVVTGINFINFGTKVSPFIIGGISGKLGATNVEVSLNDENYFIGKIDDIRIYNKLLNPFELYSLARTKYYNNWEDMTYYLSCPTTTRIEEIDFFHLNKYKGAKSNKFNLKIKNSNISDSSTQQMIIDNINDILPKIIPANTQLNEILFE